MVVWGLEGTVGAFSLVGAGLFYCFASKKTQRWEWYHLPAIKIVAANSDWTSPGLAAQCWTSGKKMMTKTRPLTMIPQVWSEKEKGPFHLNSLSPGVVMHRPGWASPGSLPVTRNGNVARAIICRAVSEMPGKGGSVRTPLLPLDASFPTDNPQEHSLFWEGFFLSHWGPKANWNKS